MLFAYTGFKNCRSFKNLTQLLRRCGCQVQWPSELSADLCFSSKYTKSELTAQFSSTRALLILVEIKCNQLLYARLSEVESLKHGFDVVFGPFFFFFFSCFQSVRRSLYMIMTPCFLRFHGSKPVLFKVLACQLFYWASTSTAVENAQNKLKRVVGTDWSTGPSGWTSLTRFFFFFESLIHISSLAIGSEARDGFTIYCSPALKQGFIVYHAYISGSKDGTHSQNTNLCNTTAKK